MYCQCLFDKEGVIKSKAGGIAGFDFKAKTIKELFDEIGLQDEECKVGSEYSVSFKDKQIQCFVNKLGEDFLFISIDVTKLEYYKTYYESQSRISDLNMSRLLKSIDDLVAENHELKKENSLKKDLISKTSHELRSSLSDVVGLVEVVGDLPANEQRKYLDVMKETSNQIVKLLDKFQTN